jgi:hypothetical protein
MAYTCWEIDVSSVLLQRLLEWCLHYERIDHMLFGIRMCIDTKHGRKRVPCKASQIRVAFEHFGKAVDAVYSVRGWPGTEFYSPSPLLKLTLSTEILNTIVRLGPYLNCWTSRSEPPLPEDICLYREGARFPAVVTVAHEDRSWLITNKNVDLPGTRRVKTPRPSDLIFEGPFFSKNVRLGRFPFMKKFYA